MPTPLRASARASWTVRRPLPPIEGESLDGFIARIAAHNMLDNALAITTLGGVIYGHVPRLSTHGWEGLHSVAQCLDVPIEALQQRSYPPVEPLRDLRLFFGVPIERRHLEIRTRRFSPAALQISPHHRAAWQLRPFPFCTETWQYLIDRCPRCSGLQRWHRTNGIERCDHCVEDLRRAPAELVPPEERETAQAALDLVHPDPDRRLASLASLPPDIQKMGPGGALDLLVRLLALVDESMPRAAACKKRAWPASPSRVTAALSRAWPLLTGWPEAPLAFMSSQIEKAPTRFSDGNNGKTLRFLKRSPTWSNAAVEDAIAGIRAQVDVDGPHRADILDRTTSLKAAAKAFALGTKELAAIRRRGGLPSTFTLEAGRAVARLDAASVAEIQELLKQRISFERAAWRLGISYHGVEQLAAMSLLPAIPQPFFLLRYGGPQTTLEGLAGLESALEAGATLSQRPHLIRLRRAAHAIGGHLKPWGPILQSLLDGTIPYALAESSDRLSYRILVPARAIGPLTRLRFDAARFPEATFANSMTRHDAGEALNLQPKDYTPFLRTYEAGTPGTDRIVPVADVLTFARGLISTSEVAMRLGIDPGIASRRLKKLHLGAVAGSLWDRSSVERLLAS
ncbi:MAG TPA: hypothetical protein VF605_19615 [Allosphingosinicella sp.]